MSWEGAASEPGQPKALGARAAPPAFLFFLGVSILHLIAVCGSVLFSRVTKVSNTNLIFQAFCFV